MIRSASIVALSRSAIRASLPHLCDPAGKVRFGHDYVDVVSDGTFIDPGETVRAVQVRGNRVVVRRVEPSA